MGTCLECFLSDKNGANWTSHLFLGSSSSSVPPLLFSFFWCILQSKWWRCKQVSIPIWVPFWHLHFILPGNSSSSAFTFYFYYFFFFGYVLSLCYRLKEGILKMARASAIGMFSLTFKVTYILIKLTSLPVDLFKFWLPIFQEKLLTMIMEMLLMIITIASW